MIEILTTSTQTNSTTSPSSSTVSWTYILPMRWEFCAKCGRKVEGGWNYCSGCGTSIGTLNSQPYYPIYPTYPVGTDWPVSPIWGPFTIT